MTAKETSQVLLSNAHFLELATETLEGHTPSVRTMNFLYFPEERENVIYICTNKDAHKVTELRNNPNVSFTTTQVDGGSVRVTGAVAEEIPSTDMPKIFNGMDHKYADFQKFTPEDRANMTSFALSFQEVEVYFRGTEHVHF